MNELDTTPDVSMMNIEALLRFINGKICEEAGCVRECARGYVICIQHLHGSSDMADDVFIAAKKRLAALRKKGPADAT